MKSTLILILLMLWFPAHGSAEQELKSQIEQVISQIDFQDVEDLQIPGPSGRRSASDTVRALATGETLSAEDMLFSVLNTFFEELSSLGGILFSLMFPILLSSILNQIIDAKESRKSLSHYVCSLLVLIPIVLLVCNELERARSTITIITQRMDKMLSLLLPLLTALGGNASSAFLHPVVVAASGSMVFLAREVILRLVMCTCAVTIVNHLSLSAHLTRMAQLLRSAVCWLLGVSFTVFLGTMSFQGVCSASIDGVVIRAAKYAVDNFVPIVGGMFSDTMDTLVGCTLIVKNALGICAALVLLGVVLAPLMHTAAVVFMMKLGAALLEPVAEPEIVRAIGDFASTIVLFLVTMLCVGTMYFLLIVQMLLVGNLTVMLR
ncbi:MAG: stage III sporulation protein AE [Clostridia bacterium]|nr:stage III sporulation protein AE [Clostridia bacterium]